MCVCVCIYICKVCYRHPELTLGLGVAVPFRGVRKGAGPPLEGAAGRSRGASTGAQQTQKKREVLALPRAQVNLAAPYYKVRTFNGREGFDFLYIKMKTCN